MADGGARRVLVTGVAGPIAAALARRLAGEDAVEYLAGLDTEPPGGPHAEPPGALARMEFVQGDSRSPVVPRLLESARIDTLVHISLRTGARESIDRTRMKEHNVIGTMQLLAAAQNAPRLRQAVVRSSTAVYGSSHRNPALLPEDAHVSTPRSGYARDAAEVEAYARRLARRREDVAVTVLRLAHLVGPQVETSLTRYFALPVAPTMLGYDPRLQLLDADDAVEVMTAAVLARHSGIYNVAGRGAMYLSQALRLAGRPAVPVAGPLMPVVAGVLRRTGLAELSSDRLEFLMHGRVADTSRLRDGFGLAPRHSTRAAFERFLAARGIEPVIDPELFARLERWGLRVLKAGEGTR